MRNGHESRFFYLSWFLDMVSPGWSALVDGDYEAILPLPIKKKYLFQVCLQPFLVKYLTIVANNTTIDQTAWKKAVKNIFKKLAYAAVNVKGILYLDAGKSFSLYAQSAQEMDILKSYDEIRNGFLPNVNKNLKKADRHVLSFHSNVDFSVFESLKRLNYRHKTNENVLEILRKIFYHPQEDAVVHMHGIKNENNEFIIASLAIEFKNRLHFISSGATHEARHKKAKFMMYNEIIRKFSGKSYTIDFMGSDIDNVAYFNHGFGASNYHYYHLRGGYVYKMKNIFKK